MNREQLTKHLNNPQDRYLAMKLIDKIEMSMKNSTITYTDFLDPYQMNMGIQIINQYFSISYFSDGGFQHAERKILIIHPEYLSLENFENPLRAIEIFGDFNKTDLSHRDFLGSILGLGIKREKTGDIYISDGKVALIVYKEVCDYIISNLHQVGKYKITAHHISMDDISEPEEKFKLIHSTVQSLRLDAILSVGFEESRSAITKKVNHDRVKVNWKPVNNPSYLVNCGDIISYKGLGRIQFVEMLGKSKKDRIKITIKRFL